MVGSHNVLRLLDYVGKWFVTKKSRADLMKAMIYRSYSGRGLVKYDPILHAQLVEMGILNQRGSGPVRPMDTRTESALYEVVGAEGDERIPTSEVLEPSTMK